MAGAVTKKTSAIAARPTRRARAAAFQAYVLGASVAFVALAVAAHYVPYFGLDLRITKAVQSLHVGVLDAVLRALTWAGFVPQVDVIGTLLFLTLFLFGLRWEAVGVLFAYGITFVGMVVKLLVVRPRPSADLVYVMSQLDSTAFPSGHVLAATSVCGYLAFLAYTLLKPSARRTALIGVALAIVPLMGVSRIYLGQHWFSDVMGAYLLASLWLALTIRFYRWGKPRFFRRQPVAPEAPGR